MRSKRENMSAVDYSFRLPGSDDVGILMVHGLGGTPVEMRYVAQGLARARHTVHVCQLAGHCSSLDDLIKATSSEWYESVLAAYENLRKECSTIYVAGFCAGAMLTLKLAIEKQSEIKGMILYAPAFWYDGWSIPKWLRSLKFLVNTPLRHLLKLPGREPFGIKDARVRSLVVEHLQSGNSGQVGIAIKAGNSFREIHKLVKEVKPRLKELKLPTLLVHSRDDDAVSLKNTFHLQKSMSGVVETVVLDDCYHIITIDRQRQLVVDKTRNFISWLEHASPSKSRVPTELRVAAE